MIEAGSFRDPEARVFYNNDRVLRGLSASAAGIDAAARDSGLMARLVDDGLFVANWVTDEAAIPDGVPDSRVIESARLPVITYPSEWSFRMLQDAATLTLDANLMAMKHGFILKDASAFNVAFEGTSPRILDITSLDRFGDKGVWVAYAQFCDHFLAPLMLEAYAGVPFQRTLLGTTEGIPIGDLRGLLRGRSGLKKGVLSHVKVRSALDRRAAGMDTEARSDVGQTTLPAAIVEANISKMRKLVAGLTSTAASTWADYEADLPYEDEGVADKSEFVGKAAAAARDHSLAVDVGANAGLFTRLLGDTFEYVVGIDFDPGAIDALYRSMAGQDAGHATPAVIDVINPTPAHGWRGLERTAFWDRVQPSFTTWLAVVHHLSLGAGIPLDQVVKLVYEVSPESVVEFVAPDDPMARHITATRSTDLTPYTKGHFEQYAAAGGTIITSRSVSDTRTLYHLRRH